MPVKLMSMRTISGRVITTYLVNSEGTIVRKSSALFQEGFAVGTQAADGMRLERSRATTAVSLQDLEPQDSFERKAVEQIASLADLRKAPLVEEEYHGPVLLSSDAGTDTLRGLLEGGLVAGGLAPRVVHDEPFAQLVAEGRSREPLPAKLPVRRRSPGVRSSWSPG